MLNVRIPRVHINKQRRWICDVRQKTIDYVKSTTTTRTRNKNADRSNTSSNGTSQQRSLWSKTRVHATGGATAAALSRYIQLHSSSSLTRIDAATKTPCHPHPRRVPWATSCEVRTKTPQNALRKPFRQDLPACAIQDGRRWTGTTTMGGLKAPLTSLGVQEERTRGDENMKPT